MAVGAGRNILVPLRQVAAMNGVPVLVIDALMALTAKTRDLGLVDRLRGSFCFRVVGKVAIRTGGSARPWAVRLPTVNALIVGDRCLRGFVGDVGSRASMALPAHGTNVLLVHLGCERRSGFHVVVPVAVLALRNLHFTGLPPVGVNAIVSVAMLFRHRGRLGTMASGTVHRLGCVSVGEQIVAHTHVTLVAGDLFSVNRVGVNRRLQSERGVNPADREVAAVTEEAPFIRDTQRRNTRQGNANQRSGDHSPYVISPTAYDHFASTHKGAIDMRR